MDLDHRIIIGFLFALIIITFVIGMWGIIDTEKNHKGLDNCVSQNIIKEDYDYNAMIKCCIEIGYRESYCLSKFKPGYELNNLKGKE